MDYITFSHHSRTTVYGIPAHIIAKLYAEHQTIGEPHSVVPAIYRQAHAYILDNPELLLEFARTQVDFSTIQRHICVIDDFIDQVRNTWSVGDLDVEEIAWELN